MVIVERNVMLRRVNYEETLDKVVVKSYLYLGELGGVSYGIRSR